MEGLTRNNDEESYRDKVIKHVSWCDNSNLILHASKTKEMVINFRHILSPLTPMKNKNETIKKAESFKCLGTTLDLNMGQEEHVGVAA